MNLDTKYKMVDIILGKNWLKDNCFWGKPTLVEEFNDKQYIPTTVNNLVNEKVTNDYETIKKALELIAFYKSKGLTDFDFDLNNILKIEENNEKI